MAEENNNLLFSEDVLNAVEASSQSRKVKTGPVTVLGRTFPNDEERRAYFREELRRRLPELKKIEGYPIGEDDDIVALSDPPFYTACPNPWLNDFVSAWEEEKKELVAKGKRIEEKVVTEPYASDVTEGKNNAMYSIHSYHTKVPHPAIMRYLLHYTEPGDIVYDGFAGTGMTGVAANECGNKHNALIEELGDKLIDQKWGARKAIVSDLSPVASFISANLNRSFDADEIKKSLTKKIEAVYAEYKWMYETKSYLGGKAEINYVVWTEMMDCPECGTTFPLFNTSVDHEAGEMKSNFLCPHCHASLTKERCNYSYSTEIDIATGEPEKKKRYVIALINYFIGRKRYTKEPDQEDSRLLERIDQITPSAWFPTEKIMFKGESWGDTWRAGVHSGVKRVSDFYTKRNLIFISALWEKLTFQEKFIATSILSRNLTKLNRFIVNKHNPQGRVNGPLSGTFYISSEFVEQNPVELLLSKIPSFSWQNNNVVTSVCAAQRSLLADNTIDYIFTDPPFGANIMYSELNFLWEAWLKVYTENSSEAIENDSQNKTTLDYGGLMTDCFKEYFRVLKPGKWMTVEFSNTSAAIWNAIQNSINQAGFVIVNVSALDKKHGGIKSMTYTTTVKEDLVISCYKPTKELESKVLETSHDQSNVWDFVDDYLNHIVVHLGKDEHTNEVAERNPKIIYDKVITYYLQKGLPVPIDALDFQKGLRERYEECDGMFFTAKQLVEYREKKKHAPELVPMGLIIASEADGIEWLRVRLRDNPQTYQDLQPGWMQSIGAKRKGDILPELREILEENFIEDAGGKWRLPNIQDDVDKDKLREKALLKEFKVYVDAASKPRARIKEVRVEAIRYGFKKCYMEKDFATIVMVGEKIPQNLLTEDEILLQFYDIARTRV